MLHQNYKFKHKTIRNGASSSRNETNLNAYAYIHFGITIKGCFLEVKQNKLYSHDFSIVFRSTHNV